MYIHIHIHTYNSDRMLRGKAAVTKRHTLKQNTARRHQHSPEFAQRNKDIMTHVVNGCEIRSHPKRSPMLRNQLGRQLNERRETRQNGNAVPQSPERKRNRRETKGSILPFDNECTLPRWMRHAP